MKNIFISNLNKKDINHFTSDLGLYLRRKSDVPFKKLCNVFTNSNIIDKKANQSLTDEEYFNNLDYNYQDLKKYPIDSKKNNIVLERYPKLEKDKPYIFVCNHTCPEDIETVLNIIDRNAYLLLGSIESLKYNKEIYLTWINGLVPFDIMNQEERTLVLDKMERVLKTNSILMFPEGSHNYSPNKLINNLYDGCVNLSLKTGKEIVPITMLRDDENKVSYVDVGNPINGRELLLNKFNLKENLSYKDYIKDITKDVRNKMATAVHYMMKRHFKVINRKDFDNLEEKIRNEKINDAFNKLKWTRDVFEAEYLTKKTQEDKKYEETVKTISNLTLNKKALVGKDNREWVLKEIDLDNKNTPLQFRKHLEDKKKVLVKK